MGTSSAVRGAVNDATCKPCRPGTFADTSGSDACEDCPKGHSSVLGSESCFACPEGTYASNAGEDDCNPCPHLTDSSGLGSSYCGVCKAGYYLQNSSVSPSDVFAAPTHHCKDCPPHADCSLPSTTLETLGVPRGFWRDSHLTDDVYACTHSDYCIGSGDTSSHHPYLEEGAEGAGWGCDAGHTGPLCEWCVSEAQYFDEDKRGCTDCPALAERFGILAGTFTAAAGIGLLLYLAFTRTAACGRCGVCFAHRLALVVSYVGVQPKLKILVSFYQVCTTLSSVYGVHLHEDFTTWNDAFDKLDLDMLGLTYPPACLGSMRWRLLLSGLWPFAVILLGAAVLASRALVAMFVRGEKDWRVVGHQALNDLLYWAILVAYLVLPSVSRSIFEARHCESFGTNVFTGERSSYLVADLDVRCSGDDSEFRGLHAYFWAFFVLWPVLVPLTFLALLLWIRSSVRAHHFTLLARACRFLWRDYDAGFLFWEVFDIARKLLLTSLVLFIDAEYGSSKLLRLLVASFITSLFLAALALARPYKRDDDLYLACIANLMLNCCFVSGVAVQLCGSEAYEDECYTLVGLRNARAASELVIALTAAMFILSVLVVGLKTLSAVRAPTIRLACNGRPPSLELPAECHYHGFISHAWATGQDQAHVIVRQLQLLLPGIQIWLDVDNLDDVGRLEESVADAATFIIFLSAGYFESFNCRRELYAALASTRPVITVHEADTAKGGASLAALQAECRENCTEEAPSGHPSYSGPAEVVAAVFEEQDPVVWVRVHAFQLESLKAIALRMLGHFPAQLHSRRSLSVHQAELAAGVMVPGEVGPYAFRGPVTILVCRGNDGAFPLAEEVKGEADEAYGGVVSKPWAGTDDMVAIRKADDTLDAATADPPDTPQGHTVLLLYLTKRIFLDEGGCVARLVQRAMDRRIAIALVAEQAPSRGGCPFRLFFQQTPLVLQQPPYRLFDTMAVPLYPSPEHRKVSLRHVLRGMGADPCRTRPLNVKQLQLRRKPRPTTTRPAAARPKRHSRPGARGGLRAPPEPDRLHHVEHAVSSSSIEAACATV